MEVEPPEVRRGEDVQGTTTIPNSAPPLKIGGVLVIVAFGLIVSLLQNLGAVLGNLVPFRKTQVWERLTTPGSLAYHPYWKPVLLFELASSSAILGLNAMALILFFRRQRVFPKVIVVGIPIIFILMLTSHFLGGLIPAVGESPIYSKEVHALIVRFVALHVWIPYFIVSERVKKTFVL